MKVDSGNNPFPKHELTTAELGERAFPKSTVGYTPKALQTHTYPTAPTEALTWAPTAPTAPTVAPTVAPTASPTCAPIALTDDPTWAPMAPTWAPTAPTDAPTELMMFVGKKLVVVEVAEPTSGRGESVVDGTLPPDGGPPPPPPDEPLSSDGVLLRNRPVPKSTRWIGELVGGALVNVFLAIFSC